MQNLCDKYKPICFADIKGQEIAIEKIKSFIKEFPKKKALILNGPAGTGKTSLAYALASELKAEIFELNASDLRNREQLEKTALHSSQQASLFSKNKILLFDEIDGLTYDDRGGLPEILEITEKTSFPIIMTSNNIWDKKFSEIRKKAEIISLKEISYQEILKILKEIAEKESISLNEDLFKSIAINSKGDIRAALNDLQTSDKSSVEIGERNKQESIFEILKQILQHLPAKDTLELYDKVNMPLDEIFLWIEENIPSAYKGEELYSAFDALSKADVFRGRVHRQQHWRFLVYQNFFLSAGISSAKKQAKPGFKNYSRPTRILKIWQINQKQAHKKSISEKYARFCHVSRKRIMKDFPLIKQILLNNKSIFSELRLNEEEISFLSS